MDSAPGTLVGTWKRALPVGLLVSLFGASGLALSPTALAAAPDDVDLFRKIVQKAQNGGLRSPELRESVAELLVDETLSIVDEIARARDYPSWFSSQNPMIAREVRRQVVGAVEASGGQSDALYNLGTRVFSGAFAETAMAAAAGVSAPALPGSRGERSLDQAASVVTPSGPLKLQARKSTLSGDRGTTGHGNGRLDPGEVAMVTLVFENVSKRRLYSTSLYLESASDCLYLGEGVFEREVELAELDPGATDKLTFEVFASRKCAGRTARVRVRGHDTHSFPDGMDYDVNLKLGSLGSGRLVVGELDGDDYGHSEDDPVSVPRLVPDGQVELYAGLRVSGSGVARVQQRFTVPSPLRASHEPGWAPFRYGGGLSIASPVDDVDLTVPDAVSLQAGLEGHAQRFGWRSREDASLFVAVDSVIETGRPGSGSSSRTTGSGSGSGTKTSATTVVDRRQVEAVLAKHVSVSPVVSKGGRGGPGEIPLVTVDGFRVSVDDADALMAALTATTTVSRGGSSTSGRGGSSSASGGSSGNSEYRLRHYIALPVEWEPAPVPVECDISVSPRSIRVGQSVTVRGSVENAPLGAQLVLRDSMAGLIDVSLDETGSFSAVLEPAAPRTNSVSFKVELDGEELCSDVVGYSVNAEPVAAKPKAAPRSTPKATVPAWPRQVSVEPGYHRYAGGNHGQLGVTAGEHARFSGRLSFGEGLGVGVGPRFTAASDGDVTVEFSGQGLVGIDSYLGAYAEAGAVLAVHGAAGPFIQAGVGSGSEEGAYSYFSIGLGFYAPERRK